MDTQKEKYLRNEFLTLSTNGALGRSRTYSKSATEEDKTSFRNALRRKLNEYSKFYRSKVTEEEHLLNIEKLSNDLSSDFRHCLINGRFRIGIAQKALNLYLKFLWCVDLIKQPPHCPFDSIIISLLPNCRNLRWTSIDNLEDYLMLIQDAKSEAGGRSIGEWELEIWNDSIQTARISGINQRNEDQRTRGRETVKTMRKRLKTWSGRSEFEFAGNPLISGTSIHFGEDFIHTVSISAAQYRQLLKVFAGSCVPAGTSRDNPPSNSMGQWLQQNVTKTAIASYVGPILINFGLAEKQGTNIMFK